MLLQSNMCHKEESMVFTKDKLLEKYVSIYEKYIADFVPDFEVKGGTTGYVRFNDA